MVACLQRSRQQGVRQGCGLAGRRRIYYDSLVQVSQIQAEQVAAVSVTAARLASALFVDKVENRLRKLTIGLLPTVGEQGV